MGDVYGNVNVNYSYCKSVAQLKSAADYILGRRKEQEIPPDYTKMSMWERVRQLPPPTEDTSQEFEAYKNRMGYDAAKMKSIRYKMSVYDEFLEELEARKKYHGTKAYGRQSTRKYDREGR